MSQDRFFQDDGTLQSMFEKLPYWWTYESMMNTIVLEVLRCLHAGSKYEPSLQINEDCVKLAFVFGHLRLGRGYNILDVEIARASWKGREGRNVRSNASTLDFPWCRQYS